jgi:conjugative transfer region protein TrbK
MNAYLTPPQFVRIAAVAFVGLAITVAVTQSRHSNDGLILTPREPREADAVASELARCRTITLDDLGLLESCRNIWAENRQHFLQLAKTPHLLAEPAPDPSTGSPKNQDAIPLHDVDWPRAR